MRARLGCLGLGEVVGAEGSLGQSLEGFQVQGVAGWEGAWAMAWAEGKGVRSWARCGSR